ncbi:hypothetical protein DFH08DRAFT_1086491 [Mycena albidolilacea]|uniref:Uncharacterized protein n=1 Tax=Mycena albidolilacea TaxID=1033008 RepID=A0AAD7EFD0_9AGAR|nr:hypothetical protein DFH08DRAFT_1086491 [Mycena albidolilacea]
MSIGTFLLAFLTGAIVLPIALLLSPQLPDIQTVTAYLPAVSVAGVIVFGYKLVKRLIAGGGGPDISARSSTIYYCEVDDTATTQIWANTTFFALRTPHSSGAIEGKSSRSRLVTY